MERKKTKSEFCRDSFKWGPIDIKWLDLTGMSPIDESRQAKIEMSILYSATIYESFRVSIINKVTGCIDKKLFLFNDYLESETDAKPHFTVEGWSGGWGWHKDVAPKSTRPICAAIENYIDTFR